MSRVVPPITPHDWKQWAENIRRYLGLALDQLAAREASSTAAADGVILWDREKEYPVVSRDGEFVRVLLSKSTRYGQVSRMTSATVNITTAGTYQTTGMTGTLDTVSVNGFALSTTNAFGLKNITDETMTVRFYASADVDAGNNKRLGLKLALNGTAIAETECNAPTGQAASFAKLITSWMIRMEPDDEVSLFLTNFTNTGNITVERARIIAESIP